MKTKPTLFQLFVFLPLIGIIFFMTHSEYKVRTGMVYRVNIKGYDPRDLIHGHYLRYRFDLNNKVKVPKKLTTHNHSYCFTQLTLKNDPKMYSLQIFNHEKLPPSCSSTIRMTKLEYSHKYFIPENYAKQLESSLRSQSASVDLIINDHHQFSVGQLYLNDRPWEDVLSEQAQDKP